MKPFQPQYTITPQLLSMIKQIAVLIHDLNLRAYPELVLMKLRGEASALSTFASTSIEGNPLPLTEVKRLLKQKLAYARQSEQEVLNYNSMLNRLNHLSEQPFSSKVIKEIQAGVMDGLLPKHQRGEWRKEAVVIYEAQGDGIVYLLPNYADVPSLMEALVRFVEQNQSILDPVILAGLVHRQLVIIHPFMDGNGRSTRLITTLLLANLGLNTLNLFSFENYYNLNVTRYFQTVGLFGDYYELVDTLDFTMWLTYFAEGILDELYRVQKQLTSIQVSPQQRLKPYHQKILDYIDTHGFITDYDYAQLTDRAKATRTLDFNRLIEMNLIERRGKGRNTHYVREL
ncbi:MAG: Fic family protein [Chloroflexota bacterium]